MRREGRLQTFKKQPFNLKVMSANILRFVEKRIIPAFYCLRYLRSDVRDRG